MEKAEDLELFHYGVKGMKWGVRKSGDGSSRKGIRQRIKERDDNIKSARERSSELSKKEVNAIGKSLSTKADVVRDRKNPEKRAAAKEASAQRKSATKEFQDNAKVAKKMTSKEIAARGALYAIPTIASVGYIAAGTAGPRRNAKIGETLKNDIFADSRGLPKPGTIALQFVDGKWQ